MADASWVISGALTLAFFLAAVGAGGILAVGWFVLALGMAAVTAVRFRAARSGSNDGV